MWSVEEWLDKIGMSEYTEDFVDNGYETVELITQMKAEDMDAVGVTDKQHRGILFTQAKLLYEEATGTRPKPSPVSSKKPAAITISMSGSASPTTPSSTSGYTEPWDNTQSPIQSPLVAETAAYSEPWNSTALTPKSNGSSRAAIESTDSGHKPPPLPPPNKAIKSSAKSKSKAKKPPPSPGVNLPEYKRDNGEKKLTKLQLKLKIRDELQKDAIVLSEPPYINEVSYLTTIFIVLDHIYKQILLSKQSVKHIAVDFVSADCTMLIINTHPPLLVIMHQSLGQLWLHVHVLRFVSTACDVIVYCALTLSSCLVHITRALHNSYSELIFLAPWPIQ